MYISVDQSTQLDKFVKLNEVALRSYVADILSLAYNDHSSFKNALEKISISQDLIYSKRFAAKLKQFIRNSSTIFELITKCNTARTTKCFNNEVPYVSDLIDLVLIFFNTHFANTNVIRDFSSIEEFHYCCTLYHRIRNNLAHPASRPITIIDANKVVFFIENITSALDDKYYWYTSKNDIQNSIQNYKNMRSEGELRFHNLRSAASTHKTLLCRETEIENLYNCILGEDLRQRLAGSVVLYGYGGVGKTAITTEFLYRLIRDKNDGKYPELQYILLFSSKDEFLRENQTTGELYIDNVKPEFSNLDELKSLICSSLDIDDCSQMANMPGKGIIVIDNIENIPEKDKIIDFIKSLPRSIHFIVTSRNEESCEEKIHVEEFKNDATGIEFVEEIIESEGYNVDINKEKAMSILNVSKGNALIIVQILNILDRDVSTFDSITKSLESMKSKNSEMIANFMYKNTFDNALNYLTKNDFPVIEVMQFISLYDERIELYSISKLAKIDISYAERLCNYLLERLILSKSGEYYELNEFAKRFVFIRLLPDRFELSKIKSEIKNHKERMKEKLAELDSTLSENSVLHKIVTEWQPRNYIDKIVIAELFSLYGEAIKCVNKKDKISYEKYLHEFNDHSFITNHPYVPLQKARLLKEGIKRFYRNNADIHTQVEQAYEEAIESIEYDYRYLIGSLAHASLLMFFGIFLNNNLRQHSRAIRFLENAKQYLAPTKSKGWFITCNYLSSAYETQYKKTNDNAYKDQLKKVVTDVLNNEKQLRKSIDINLYKKRFLKYAS